MQPIASTKGVNFEKSFPGCNIFTKENQPQALNKQFNMLANEKQESAEAMHDYNAVRLHAWNHVYSRGMAY